MSLRKEFRVYRTDLIQQTIIRATLHVLNFLPCLMDIRFYILRQLTLFYQILKDINNTIHNIFGTIQIILKIPMTIHHKMSTHRFSQLQKL